MLVEIISIVIGIAGLKLARGKTSRLVCTIPWISYKYTMYRLSNTSVLDFECKANDQKPTKCEKWQPINFFFQNLSICQNRPFVKKTISEFIFRP